MKFNEERDLGIKITQYESLPKCISIIRNYRSDSMGLIKSEIESNDYIFVCDFADTLNIKQLLKCSDDLTEIGCTLQIQDGDEVISREIILNILQSHKEIHEETLAAIDAEVGENKEGVI